MPLTRQQKEARVGELTDALKQAKSVAVVSYQGTTVFELEELRAEIRKANGRVIVAKSNLLKRSLADAGLPALPDEQLVVPVATIVAFEDEVLPVKAIAGYAKKHPTIAFVAGMLSGQVLDEKQMKALALIPSKLELIAKTVGSIKAPLSGLVGVLSGNLRGFVSVLNQRAQKMSA